MALDATEVRVGITGNLYAAPLGTAFPTAFDTTLNAAFVDLGYLSEDGWTATPGADTTDIMGWQDFYPLRRVATGKSFEVGFRLMQTNTQTLKLAFGGGAVTVAGTGVKYTPPAPADVDERAFIFQVTDGVIIDRWCLTRGLASLDGDVTFKKDEATSYGVTIAASAVAGGANPWYILSNNADLTVG